MKTFILALLVAGSVGLPAQTTPTNSPARSNVSLDQALAFYSELTDRTVLRYPDLPKVNLSLGLVTTNRAEVTRAIETTVMAMGIAFIPDGEKFVIVAPQSAADKLNPQSVRIPVTGTNDPAARLFPKGSFNWMNASSAQALLIYAELLGKKLNPDGVQMPLPKFEIKFFNQTALTQAEMSYALETLFGWNGVKVVLGGDGFVKAVPALTESAKPVGK